jgi:hypothetical protein
MSEESCPKCQSQKVISGARLVDQMGHLIKLGVSVYEKPDAVIFKGAHSQALQARICGTCGNVEIYVDHPEELYSVHQESRTRDE